MGQAIWKATCVEPLLGPATIVIHNSKPGYKHMWKNGKIRSAHAFKHSHDLQIAAQKENTNHVQRCHRDSKNMETHLARRASRI